MPSKGWDFMSLSIFGDKAFMPSGEMLAEVLRESNSAWHEITKHISDAYGKMFGEWKYYSKSAGWSYVIKSGKRTLVYLIPLDGFFKASFVFGEKAVAEAARADLPDSITRAIQESKPYAEGRSFMADVKSEADVTVIQRLVSIKAEN